MNELKSQSQEDSEEKFESSEKERLIWLQASKFYLKSLIRKTFQAVRAHRNGPRLRILFKHWKSLYTEAQDVTWLAKEYFDTKFTEKYLAKWRNALYKQVKVKQMAGLIAKSYQNRIMWYSLARIIEQASKQELLEFHLEGKRNLLLIKSIRAWKVYRAQDQKKRLKRAEAYEFHYLKVIRKVFKRWTPAVNRIKEDDENLRLKQKFFKLLKTVHSFVESKKKKLGSLFRDLIVLKAFFKGLRDRTWWQKRNSISKNFRKMQLFMGWKIVSVKLAHKKIQKKKAASHFAKTTKAKIFEQLYKNFKKERKISIDYKHKMTFFSIKHLRNMKRIYFEAIKNMIILKKLDKETKLRSKWTVFHAWADYIKEINILKRRKKEFSKLKASRKRYNCFAVFKLSWLQRKKREYYANEAYIYKLKRKVLMLLLANKFEEERLKSLTASKHFKTILFQKVFYTIHFNMIKRRQKRKTQEKLDWFIEKKIVRVMNTCFQKFKLWKIVKEKYSTKIEALIFNVFYNWKLQTRLRQYNQDFSFKSTNHNL